MILSLTVHQHPPWKATCQNSERSVEKYLRKSPPRENFDKLDSKMTFRTIQSSPYFTVHWYLPKETFCKKKS